MSTAHHLEHSGPVTTDPVVAYDVMCEVATRVGGRLSALQDQEQDDAVRSQLFDTSVEVERRVAAVDGHDLEAVRAMTEQLREQYASLR